jgi:transposase-like protein
MRIRTRQCRKLYTSIEHDHRAVKRSIRPMLGFKSTNSARVIPGGIEMVHMMRKGQAKFTCNEQPPLAEQFTCSSPEHGAVRLLLSHP